MKPIILIILVMCSAFAFAQSEKTSAKVDEQQGISIFILSKPTAKYDYLGTIKIKITWSEQMKEYLNQALHRVKKEYPNANGVIFTDDLKNVDAILLKN